jgi:hypothetical protein
MGQLYQYALSHARPTPERAPRAPQRVDRRLDKDLIARIVAEYAMQRVERRLGAATGCPVGTVTLFRTSAQARSQQPGCW